MLLGKHWGKWKLTEAVKLPNKEGNSYLILTSLGFIVQ